MPNRNPSKPLKYPLAITIIARSKRFLLTEFYQGIRMQPHEVDFFSSACRVTDSLQKRMSLQALVLVSNGIRNGLKLILLFYKIHYRPASVRHIYRILEYHRFLLRYKADSVNHP